MVRPKTAACRDVNEARRNKRNKFRVATYGMMPGLFGKILEASCEISWVLWPSSPCEEGGWGEQVQQEWPSKSSCPSVEDVADNRWDLGGKWPPSGHGSSRRVFKKNGHFGPTWWLIPASKWNVNGL